MQKVIGDLLPETENSVNVDSQVWVVKVFLAFLSELTLEAAVSENYSPGLQAQVDVVPYTLTDKFYHLVVDIYILPF